MRKQEIDRYKTEKEEIIKKMKDDHAKEKLRLEEMLHQEKKFMTEHRQELFNLIKQEESNIIQKILEQNEKLVKMAATGEFNNRDLYDSQKSSRSTKVTSTKKMSYQNSMEEPNIKEIDAQVPLEKPLVAHMKGNKSIKNDSSMKLQGGKAKFKTDRQQALNKTVDQSEPAHQSSQFTIPSDVQQDKSVVEQDVPLNISVDLDQDIKKIQQKVNNSKLKKKKKDLAVNE